MVLKLTDKQKAFIDDLRSHMTLEEKIGQMCQEAPSIVGSFDMSYPELVFYY